MNSERPKQVQVEHEAAEISDHLHARAAEWARTRAASKESFDSFFEEVVAFQRAFSPGLRRLYGGGKVSASSIPPLPTEAFKWARVSMFEEGVTGKRFCTSGTTQAETGTHWFRTTKAYDAGALAFGRENLWGPGESPLPVLLTPSSQELPYSSLVHMLELFARSLGERDAHVFADGQPDLKRVSEKVAEATSLGRPVLLMGTSFGFVYLLDAIGRGRLSLPAGSCVMHTGGFKGRTREINQLELHGMFENVFELPKDAIFGEYGMTELSSQFYARQSSERTFIYREPPWAKVFSVDPITMNPLPEGEIGLAKIVDLFNIDSAVAVLTSDRVRRVQDGFELLGRSPLAPLRGCSLAIEQGRA